MADIRLGTQGWNYDAWVGPFYPDGTRPPDYLGVYSRAFNTVEVDSTFYAIPPAKVVRGWASRVPAGFTFALKLPQAVTHEQRLRGSATDIANRFFDVARELGGKLGPILIQLGPDFAPVEEGALREFLPLLPNDLHLAIEFRQKGWLRDDICTLLHEHQVALALSDGKWIPRRQLLNLAGKPTGSFAYLRWMGPDRTIVDYSHVQVDRSEELAAWSAAVRALAVRLPSVYGYMNNHFAGHSPQSVRELSRLLGLPVVEPRQLGEQMTLF